MSTFEISVILAETPGLPDLQETLASVARSCVGLATEVLVVRPPGGQAIPEFAGLQVREVQAGVDALIPERWGAGVVAASAPFFACLTTEFTVHEDWARTLLSLLTPGVAGASGTIDLAPGARATAAATYLVRFGAYLPRAGNEPVPAADIPGDAAAYRRAAITAFPDLLATGFWEVEFHRKLIAAGNSLLLSPRPLSTFRPTRGFVASLLLRYRHGKKHGGARVVRYRHNAWRLMAAAPLVPFVLTQRALRRSLSAPGLGALTAKSLPGILGISTAWAVGEAVGAWSARRR